MTPENFTWAWGAPAEFILLGITDRWDLRLTLFLIFLPAMREVTTSILLYGPFTRTLGVQIYAMQDAGSMSEAAALGSVAIVLIFICDTIVKYITKDRKGV